MSWLGAAISGVTGLLGIVASARGADAQRDAAGDAAAAQERMYNRGLEVLTRQLAPYRDIGERSLLEQQELLGMTGDQGQALRELEESPLFQGLLGHGENAILQNAAATGGLRGGNTQAALAQFAPELLYKLYNDQYSKLQNLTALGQASAAGVGSAALNTNTNIGNALAQSAITRGEVDSQFYNNVFKGLGYAIQGIPGIPGILGSNTNGAS